MTHCEAVKRERSWSEAGEVAQAVAKPGVVDGIRMELFYSQTNYFGLYCR